MDAKTLTIAVNGYRNPELLRLCLRSVFGEMKKTDIDYEVIVTDSATEEDTEILMREEFPQARFFPFKKNVGFKTLVNTSLQEARGDYVFLINNDIVLTEDAVPRMLTYLQEHPKVGIVSPKQLNFNDTLQQSCFRFYRPLTIVYRRTWLGKLPCGKRHLDWFTMAEYEKHEPQSVDWVMGSAMFVARAAAQKVGLMDDRFFMYMEDVDWCRRFWENGYRVVYYSYVHVYHYHGKGSAKGGFFGSLFFNRLTWYHIASAVQYFWKYRKRPLPITDLS